MKFRRIKGPHSLPPVNSFLSDDVHFGSDNNAVFQRHVDYMHALSLLPYVTRLL